MTVQCHTVILLRDDTYLLYRRRFYLLGSRFVFVVLRILLSLYGGSLYLTCDQAFFFLLEFFFSERKSGKSAERKRKILFPVLPPTSAREKELLIAGYVISDKEYGSLYWKSRFHRLITQYFT